MPLQLTKRLLEDVSTYVDERYVPEQEGAPKALAASLPSSNATDSILLESSADEDVCFAAAPCSDKKPAAKRPRRTLRRFDDIFPRTKSIDDVLAQKQSSFSEALLQQIDERKLTDPEVYKRANIDRKLFSKIRSNAQYQPKKSTAVALALALRMNVDDTLDLIGRAGYTLTASSRADLIIIYFIEHECWDVNLINQVLYEFDQPLIGR